MKAPSTRLSLAAITIAALFATPAAAAPVEEAVVPPSNSAATQYTETFPTSGGDKKTDQKPKHSSPAKVLGSHNAEKLERRGPEGRATAEAAAATAPTSIPTSSTVHAPSTQGADSGNGAEDRNNGNGGASAPRQKSDAAEVAATAPPPATEPSGSSGVGSAIGQATGLSSASASGPLLPLLIFATVLWALAYLWRQRRQVD